MKLFVFFFFTSSLIAQELNPPSIPIYDPLYSQVLSPKSETEVGLHQKLEIGVHMPDSVMKKINAFLFKYQTPTRLKINPFLEWEIDVQATFTHLETNDSITVNGFFYQDYTRNFDLNDWELKNSEFPFRIRFAPHILGTWKQQVKITIKNQPSVYLATNEFEAVESDSKGYVNVHPNTKNLQRNNEMIFPVGHNFIAPDEGVDVYHNAKEPHLSPDQTHKATDLGDWVNYLNVVERYFQQGGKYIRTIQAPWSSLIEFEEKGNYFNRLHYAWEQDNLIEICEKYDALVLFNFMLQEPLMNYGDYYFYDWDWDKYGYDKNHVPSDPYPVYGYNDNPGVKQPHEMFLLEDDLKYHEQRTRYYVSRYGYSTSIYEFEILSEPYHLDQHWNEGGTLEPYFDLNAPNHDVVVKAINNYQRRMAHYIKHDLQHTNHLIGINTTHPLWTPHGFHLVDSSLFSPDVDVIGMNPYAIITSKLIISKSPKTGQTEFAENENSYAKMINDYHKLFGKPVLFSETGPSETFFECSDYAEFNIDNSTLSFTGIAGYNMWNGFRRKENHLWESTILAQNNAEQHLLAVLENSMGNWLQGRQKEPLQKKDEIESKELQYYLSEDLLNALGYVRNRTFNFYTKQTDSTCSLPLYKKDNYPLSTLKDIHWNDGKKRNYLIVEGLMKREKFIIEWYKDGNLLLKEDTETNRKGRLTLKFPALVVENTNDPTPVLWFKLTAKKN